MAVRSYWMESSPGPSYPPLDRDVEADVVVIGAGIAGLSAAWELSRTGRSVVVLEAHRVASGVTGFTTAKLTAAHTLIYSHLRKAFGPESAALYASSHREAVEHVARTVTEIGIDCEFERVPAYTYVESAGQVDAMREEAEAAQEAGLPAAFTTETGLPYAVAGAIRVEDQAQFHPRRYLLALLAHMTEPGTDWGQVRVFEHTRAVGLDEGRPCRVRTTGDGGRFTARAADVVVATHFPVFDRALMFARLKPHRELVVAAPIEAGRDPRGAYLTTEESTRSVRTAPYGEGHRLLIVTGEKFGPGTVGVEHRFARLARWVRDRFGLAEEDLAAGYRWAAQDNATTDRVPYIGKFHVAARHTWVATGFGGWGMSAGVLAGRLLTDLIDGREPPAARLYDPTRVNPLREGVPFLAAQLSVGRHFVGDRLRTRSISAVTEVPPGTGAVVKLDGRRCAVYRDEDGRATVLSARCTHLGCIVAFNDAETTWDCPCHGSRFAVDGTVVQGPAQKPLAQQSDGEAGEAEDRDQS